MQFDNVNKPKGFVRLARAMGHSLRALRWLVKHESAFRQELVLLIASVVAITLLDFSLYEQLAITCATLLVMFAEITNTAIEAAIDRIGLELHQLSGLAKDLASAGVFITIIILCLVWLAVLYQNFLV